MIQHIGYINYPKTQVAHAIQTAIDGFKASCQGDILRILREIRNRLETLDDQDRLRKGLREGDAAAEEARQEFNAIVAWFDARRDIGGSS